MWATAAQIIFFRYRSKPRKTNNSTPNGPQAIRSASAMLQLQTLPLTFYIAHMSFLFLSFVSFHPPIWPSFLLCSFLTPNVVTSLASCFPSNRDTSLSFRTSGTTCQSLAHFYNDESSSMFLPNSGDYLHDKITSLPSTPHYSYLDQGWPATTASRAALLGSNQAKATLLFIKSNVR